MTHYRYGNYLVICLVQLVSVKHVLQNEYKPRLVEYNTIRKGVSIFYNFNNYGSGTGYKKDVILLKCLLGTKRLVIKALHSTLDSLLVLSRNL